MSTKITQEQVKAEFVKRGYDLISPYRNSKTKMHSICPAGHNHATLWSNFKKGHGCATCAGQVITTEKVKNLFAKQGYQLLNEYKDASSPLFFVCQKNHRSSVTWSRFSEGHRCNKCSGKVVDIEIVKKFFEERGYTLLSTKYRGSKSFLRYLCPAGHERKVRWSHFKKGQRCAVCAGQVVTQKEVEAALEKEGYSLTSNYINSYTNFSFVCPEGHKHRMAWSNFKNGSRCGKCASGTTYSFSKPGILYYLRFRTPSSNTSKYLYKIGITNNTPAQRFAQEPTPYEVIHTERFDKGADAYDREQAILKKYAAYRYDGPPVLKSGNTELFNFDVLCLDPNPRTFNPIALANALRKA